MRVNKLSIAMLAATTVSAVALGWGIVVPNGQVQEGEEESNQYFLKEGHELVRYDCPPGTVATEESCKDRRAPLGNYDRILASLNVELSLQLGKVNSDIKEETMKLKEADAKTKALRAMVEEYNNSLTEAEEEALLLVAKKDKAMKNLGLVQSELQKIEAELKNSPSGEALTRLLTEKKINLELRTRYTSEKVSLLKALEKNTAAQEKINESIGSTNEELERYLKQLEVSSPKLTQLQAKAELLEQETGLVDELEERLKTKIACHLANWEEPGAPELFSRLLRHIEKCKVEAQQQGTPVQQGNPIQQGKPQQQATPQQQSPQQQGGGRRP